MDDIDGISDQARQDVRHRVDAKREPIASACLDRYVRAHLVPAVCVGVPGGKEVHGVSAFLELHGEVRTVDDGAARPGRQERANLCDPQTIPPIPVVREKSPSTGSWFLAESRHPTGWSPVGSGLPQSE